MNKKNHIVFVVFHFMQLYIVKKTSWFFSYIKCRKFWSISLEHFFGHKSLISEECLMIGYSIVLHARNVILLMILCNNIIVEYKVQLLTDSHYHTYLSKISWENQECYMYVYMCLLKRNNRDIEILTHMRNARHTSPLHFFHLFLLLFLRFL